jgi:hypothetical protein
MKDMRNGLCPLCGHNEILEASAVEFGDGDTEKVSAVTYDPRWVLPSRNPNYPHGPLKLYVCRRCGYTQWFADCPENIPVGGQYGTRIIAGPDTDIYR